MSESEFESRAARRKATGGASAGASGHEPDGGRSKKLAAAGLLGLLVIGAGAYALTTRGGSDSAAGGKCSGSEIPVAADPSISPALTKALDGYKGDKDDNGCTRTFRVMPVANADMIKQMQSGASTAQLWVADSARWYTQASKAVGTPITPGAAFAATPVVISGPSSQLDKLGSADAAWSKVASANPSLTVGDITTDTASALAVTSAQDALGFSSDSAKSFFGRLAQTARLTIPSDAPHVTTEARLAAYNRTAGSKLAERALEGGSPLVTLTAAKLASGDASTDAAYKDFMGRMESSEGQKALQGAGFRNADGSVKGADAPEGANRVTTAAAPSADKVDGVLAAWNAMNQPLRLLTAIDVSGSMSETTNGTSRIEGVVAAAKAGINVLPPSTALGVWEFSTNLDGDKDYKVLLPTAKLSDPGAVKRANDAVDELPNQVAKGGDTGLYDTIWAAYQAAQKDYQPGSTSTVLIITDGKNDDPKGGLSLDQLKEKLTKARDPKRPVDISTLAVGDQVDTAVMTEIAKITGNGGSVYTADSPQDVGTQLAKSLADRAAG